MTLNPALCNGLPNHPLYGPYTSTSARPTTMGDTEIERSIKALSSRLPGNRYRASSTDTATPKTVLIATDATVMIAVSLNACSAWLELIAFQNCEPPCSTTRQKTITSGSRT